jgi:hypothetical protein
MSSMTYVLRTKLAWQGTQGESYCISIIGLVEVWYVDDILLCISATRTSIRVEVNPREVTVGGSVGFSPIGVAQL